METHCCHHGAEPHGPHRERMRVALGQPLYFCTAHLPGCIQEFSRTTGLAIRQSLSFFRGRSLDRICINGQDKNTFKSHILNDPFKSIVEAKKKSLSAHNSNIWCNIVDAFQTSATNDYKLKDLMKIFSLSGELLTG